MGCPAGTREQLKRRESLLNVMGSASVEQINGDVDFWKQMDGASLTNIYAFEQAIITIRQRRQDYFRSGFIFSGHGQSRGFRCYG